MKNECYKESYETEQQARRAALGINKRKKGGQMRVYKCSDCGNYHLTSKKQYK